MLQYPISRYLCLYISVCYTILSLVIYVCIYLYVTVSYLQLSMFVYIYMLQYPTSRYLCLYISVYVIVSYLKLSDVTRPFAKPSIMDVKIGAITYDSEADSEKRQRERAKFPKLEQVKFQLVGMKVSCPCLWLV